MATTTPIASAVPWVFAFSMLAEKSIVVDPKSPGSINSPHGLILFEGVCVLCSRGCDFVSKRDRRGYFCFVPMQLAEGRPLAGQLGINPDRPDSFAFVASGVAVDICRIRIVRGHRERPETAGRCAWRRLAAAGMTKGSGVTGALMAAFSAQECANYVRHAGYASKRPESVLS